MAEYCRNCAVKMFGEKIAAKHYKGLCKKGETYMELCEGCGDFVELDYTGWRVDSRAEAGNYLNEEKTYIRGIGSILFPSWLRRLWTK